MAEELHILEQEYCPPIDPALVHAIYSDYAGTPDGISLARALLDDLKLSATAEQFTDFDPSGSSGDGGMNGGAGQRSDDAESNADTWASRTTITESTTLSTELGTLSIGGRSGSGSEASSEGARGAYFRDSENFDTSTKELLLAETFPTLRPELCARTLKRCNDDLSKATDELLNHVYFEDSRTSPSDEVAPVARGIDAFSEEYHVPQRGKKGKAKRRKQKSANTYFESPGSGSDVESPSQPVNRWTNSSKDVEFITARTSLSAKVVSSSYHENGASLSATILALLKKDLTKHKSDKEPDAALIQPAIDLVADYPSIDLEYAIALVRLAESSSVNAKELADALTVQPASETSRNGNLKVIPRYAPVNISEAGHIEHTNLPELPPSVRPRDSAALAAARSDAFTKASSAYRRGKSTPLMKAAAGYYAQVGRDLNANLKAVNEVDADALVSSQSGATYLDLHGVSVKSATRIAKERTQAWWDGLGEQRIPGGGRSGVGGGYRIITGLGRHSEGGRGKIGPAVVKALVGEGWRIEVGSGELLVVGVARRA